MPGAYRCICVRLDVHHLAVTAIEQSVVLNVLEGTGAAQVPETCGAAFRVLKGLVHRWLIDATLQSNASRSDHKPRLDSNTPATLMSSWTVHCLL